MIELCNEAQKDMWINIPAMATPQFVQSLAQLIAAELDPNLNVYVEYGNEDWNGELLRLRPDRRGRAGQPGAEPVAGPIPARRPADRLHAGERRPDLRPGLRGGAGSRVRPILGGQASWTPFQTDELQFIQQQFGPPSQYIYALAVAPYVGDQRRPSRRRPDARPALRRPGPVPQHDFVSWITSNAALAKQYGVPLVGLRGRPGPGPEAPAT